MSKTRKDIEGCNCEKCGDIATHHFHSKIPNRCQECFSEDLRNEKSRM